MALALKKFQDDQLKQMPMPELEVVRPAPKKRRSSAALTAAHELASGEAAHTVTAVAASLVQDPTGASGSRRASTRAVRPPRGLPGTFANSSRQMRHCLEIIRDLHQKKHYDYAWPFYEPLDWNALGLLDYPTIVDTPMDLGTVKRKLEAGDYESADDFAHDVRLICRNCYRYNPPGDDVVMKAQRLSEHFELMFARLPEENSPDHRDSASETASPEPSSGTPELQAYKSRSAPSSAAPEGFAAGTIKYAGASNAATPAAGGRPKRSTSGPLAKRKGAGGRARRVVDSDSEEEEDDEPASAAARLLESSPHIMNVLQSLLAAAGGGEPKKKKGKKNKAAEQQQAAFLQGLIAASNAAAAATTAAPAAAAAPLLAPAPAAVPTPAPTPAPPVAAPKRKAPVPTKARAASTAAAKAPRAVKSKPPPRSASVAKARRSSGDRPAPKKPKTAAKKAPARQPMPRAVHSDDDDSDYSDTEDAPMTYDEKAQLSQDINQVCGSVKRWDENRIGLCPGPV